MQDNLANLNFYFIFDQSVKGFIVKFALILLFSAILFGTVSPIQPERLSINTGFNDSTLYVSIIHTGNNQSEQIEMKPLFISSKWFGRTVNLENIINLGDYRLGILDENGTVKYVHEYSSIFNEWKTSEQAKGKTSQIEEIIPVPLPKFKAQFVIFSRNSVNEWIAVTKLNFDPSGLIMVKNHSVHEMSIRNWHISGPAFNKIDVLAVADGYSSEERQVFQTSCDTIFGDFFRRSPFNVLKDRFNIRILFIPDTNSGITDSPTRSNFGLHFNFLGMERYLMSSRQEKLYKIIAGIPADFVVLIGHSDEYGGGGLFNNLTTLTGENSNSPFLFIHEFGHALAGLADEYYKGGESLENIFSPGIEPLAPNITITTQKDKLKWRHLLTPQIALPTEWNKLRFDEITDSVQALNATLNLLEIKEAEINSIYADLRRLYMEKNSILNNQVLARQIGLFEGAGYHADDFYRPSLNCIMFSIQGQSFDAVCEEAITKRIRYLTEQW